MFVSNKPPPLQSFEKTQVCGVFFFYRKAWSIREHIRPAPEGAITLCAVLLTQLLTQ